MPSPLRSAATEPTITPGQAGGAGATATSSSMFVQAASPIGAANSRPKRATLIILLPEHARPTEGGADGPHPTNATIPLSFHHRNTVRFRSGLGRGIRAKLLRDSPNLLIGRRFGQAVLAGREPVVGDAGSGSGDR